MKHWRSHLFALITIAIWATLEVSGKLLDGSVSPYGITAWRFLIGGLVLLPFALKTKTDERVNIRGFVELVGLGVLNVCFSMLILHLSVYYGKASLSAVILSINPLFVMLFAAIILKEKMSLGQILGLVLALVGILVLVLAEVEMDSEKYHNLPLGIALAVVAALGFGLYTVLTKRAVQRFGNIFANSISFISGAVILFLYMMFRGHDLGFAPTLPNLMLMGYLGIILTGVAYLLYFEAMKEIGAAGASMYFFLKPIISTILAWVLLNEALRGSQIAAVVLIVAAMNLPLLYRLTILKNRS